MLRCQQNQVVLDILIIKKTDECFSIPVEVQGEFCLQSFNLLLCDIYYKKRPI